MRVLPSKLRFPKAKASVPAGVGSQLITSDSQFTLTGKPGEKKPAR